jgi:hypothetical protein
MSEEKIQELLKSLFLLKYNWKSDRENYTSDVINKEGKSNVENIIRSFLLDNRDEKLGVLEAKVFVYEEMIAKSTFAAMLVKEQKEVEETIEHEPYQREMLFTQRQIEHLKNKVYQITGEGEVMQLFNEMLCVNAGW